MIDCYVGGDLNNQIAVTSYTLKDFNIPYLGVYSACSTLTESIIVASLLLSSGFGENILFGSSSHNETSERQFRNPTEYGGQKSNTLTSTATGAGCGILSKKVTDEMYIKIYSKKEVEDARNRVLNKEPTVIEVIKEIEKECVCPDVNNDACINNSDNNTFDLNVSNENSNENVLVNINTASKSELMTIKGIGDKKAEKIIEYRTSNKFLKIEDIMNVSGIGEAMFEKIKNYITV